MSMLTHQVCFQVLGNTNSSHQMEYFNSPLCVVLTKSTAWLHKQGSKHRIGVSCSKPEHKAEPRYRTQIPKFQRVSSPLPREMCRFLNSFLSPAHFEAHKVPVLPWRSAPTRHFSPPALTNPFPNCLWGLKWETLLYKETCLSPPTLSNQAAQSSWCDTLMRPWHAVFLCPSFHSE